MVITIGIPTYAENLSGAVLGVKKSSTVLRLEKIIFVNIIGSRQLTSNSMQEGEAT
jgi:hypothetical protein